LTSIKKNLVVSGLLFTESGMNPLFTHQNLFPLAMKTTFKSLLVLAAFAPFALASCSESTEKNAEATAEGAANDAANNVENAGDAIEGATDNAAADLNADMQREPGDTAVVQNKEADKLVEKVPAKQD
jgi:sulfite reductase alpha subunit-like flavoprotein